MIRRYGFGTGRAARRRTSASPAGGGGSNASFAALVATLFASGAPGGAWNFSDATTLRQDAAGTLPVTAPDQPVARASDISGRGQHLTQASAPAMPLWTALPGGGRALFFDGVDDFLSLPNLDLTTTDKIAVIAGVRKLGDTPSPRMLMETSDNLLNNPGTWHVNAPAGSATAYYYTRSRGDGTGQAVTASGAGYAAPHSAVLTSLYDIAAPSVALRVNGTLIGAVSVSQGTGNFGAWPLYVGRRGGTTQAYLGYLTALIVIGRTLTAEEITLIEAAVNAGLGAY